MDKAIFWRRGDASRMDQEGGGEDGVAKERERESESRMSRPRDTVTHCLRHLQISLTPAFPFQNARINICSFVTVSGPMRHRHLALLPYVSYFPVDLPLTRTPQLTSDRRHPSQAPILHLLRVVHVAYMKHALSCRPRAGDQPCLFLLHKSL